MLQALIDKRIGRRDQAQAWVWRLAEYTRELHEEYAVQRWPETKRLLGLLVNSSGRAHGRNARRLVHAARKQDRRLAVGLLAAAVSHTPEGEEVLRGARMRMARKPSAVARELLRNFPKGGKRRKRKRNRNRGEGENGNGSEAKQNGREAQGGEAEFEERSGEVEFDEIDDDAVAGNGGPPEDDAGEAPKPKRKRTKPKDKPAKVKKAARAKKAKPAKKADPDDDLKVSNVKDARPKAAPKRKCKAKAANGDGPDSEAGQVDVPGTEGDAVSVSESDE